VLDDVGSDGLVELIGVDELVEALAHTPTTLVSVVGVEQPGTEGAQRDPGCTFDESQHDGPIPSCAAAQTPSVCPAIGPG